MGDASTEGGPPVDAGPMVVTVQGHVIDRWRHPMAAVPIVIGTHIATTDANGAFIIPGVQTPYDVNLVVEYSNGPYSWLYQGISRANPTLQVDTWVMPFRYAHYFDWSITNPTFPLPNNSVASFVWGSADGRHDDSGLTSAGYSMEEPGWSGPANTAGTSYVLKWTINASSLPTAYTGYDFLATTLKDMAQTTIALDLSKNPTIAAGPASGTITHSALMGSWSDVYVTFNSGANMKVVDAAPNAGNTFSFVLPTISGATGTICVQEGAVYDLPFAMVHKGGLSANQTGVAIQVPPPAVPMAPSQGATVSTTTDFAWTGGAGVSLFVAEIPNPTGTDTHYRVLTAQKTARLPKYVASTGVVVPASLPGFWHIETHGPYATMDAATDSKGFVDPFDYSGSIDGPVDRDGEMLMSAGRGFTTTANP
jgi:hypothetical protein